MRLVDVGEPDEWRESLCGHCKSYLPKSAQQTGVSPSEEYEVSTAPCGCAGRSVCTARGLLKLSAPLHKIG